MAFPRCCSDIKTRLKRLPVNAFLLFMILKQHACDLKETFVEIFADRTRFQVLTVRGLYALGAQPLRDVIHCLFVLKVRAGFLFWCACRQ